MLHESETRIEAGTLVYNSECNCLELDGYELQCGESIEIRVFGSWIPGRVAVDPGGWYLFTLDHVGIRLHTGLPARFAELRSVTGAMLEETQKLISRVLIVDDDQALLRALERALALRLPQVQVDSTDSPHEALKMLQEQSYDAIVSDIKMPEMDGLELLAKTREIQPGTPTLLITGHGEHNLAIQALRGGAYDYIQKPIEREDFIATLLRAIQTCQLRRQVEQQQRALEQHARSMERLVQQRTQELLEANVTKDRVIALVTQELKQPLERLKEMSQVLRHKLNGVDVAEIVYRGFEDIEHSTEHIESLVQELLTTSRTETRMFILHRECQDVLNLLQRALEEHAASNAATLACEYTGEQVLVEVDVERMEHVIHTLLSCACTHATKGMPVTITVQMAGREVIITLRDLCPQVRQGSGLYVARKIVERHGGHLEIQHFPGDKSTIFFILPAGVPDEPNAGGPGETEHVLSTHGVWTITYEER